MVTYLLKAARGACHDGLPLGMRGAGKNDEPGSVPPSFRSSMLAKGLLTSPSLYYMEAGMWWASVIEMRALWL